MSLSGQPVGKKGPARPRNRQHEIDQRQGVSVHGEAEPLPLAVVASVVVGNHVGESPAPLAAECDGSAA